MFIARKTPKGRRVAASTKARSRRIVAEDEIEMQEGGATVAPEAADLLFEAEDVAELIAEVTGETVDVSADEDTVTFDIGEESYTVEAEGDEEVVESSTRIMSSKRRPVAASRGMKRDAISAGRTVKRFPKKKDKLQ